MTGKNSSRGETAVCQARFDEPLAGVYGDRIVLRSFSPLRAFAGGRIIGPVGHKVKRFSDKVEQLKLLTDERPEVVAATQLELAGPAGVDFAELLTMTNLESKNLEKTLGVLGGQQKAVLFDKETRRYAGGDLVESLAAGLLRFLADFHEKDSMKPGVQRGELASSWGRGLPPKLFHHVLEKLFRKGDVVAEQEVIKLKDHKVSLASDQEKVRETILAAYTKGGATPPNLKDVLEPLGHGLQAGVRSVPGVAGPGRDRARVGRHVLPLCCARRDQAEDSLLFRTEGRDVRARLQGIDGPVPQVSHPDPGIFRQGKTDGPGGRRPPPPQTFLTQGNTPFRP